MEYDWNIHGMVTGESIMDMIPYYLIGTVGIWLEYVGIFMECWFRNWYDSIDGFNGDFTLIYIELGYAGINIIYVDGIYIMGI